MLILQGGKDYQVSPEKGFARWKQALADPSNVTSHLFMPGADTPAGYRQAGGSCQPEVIDDIAGWIRAR